MADRPKTCPRCGHPPEDHWPEHGFDSKVCALCLLLKIEVGPKGDRHYCTVESPDICSQP